MLGNNPLGDHLTAGRLNDRDPIGVLLKQREIKVNIDKLGVLASEHPRCGGNAFVAQRACLPRIHDHRHGVSPPDASLTTKASRMKPRRTAIAIEVTGRTESLGNLEFDAVSTIGPAKNDRIADAKGEALVGPSSSDGNGHLAV